MSLFKSSNPVLNDSILDKDYMAISEPMTINGSINKTFIFLATLVASALAGWSMALSGMLSITLVYVLIFASMGLAFLSYFKQEWIRITGTLYCVVKGIIVGGFSAMFEIAFPGIVIQALLLTSGTLAAMLFLYKTEIIKVTEKFKSVIMMATAGIAIFYLIAFVMSMFGINIPLLHSNGPMGIGFSVLITALAALNLLLDFDFIEKGAARGLPKHMEWFGAFGLIITLVWLYLEILRLLAKLRD